jgi:hypothetical protein
VAWFPAAGRPDELTAPNPTIDPPQRLGVLVQQSFVVVNGISNPLEMR